MSEERPVFFDWLSAAVGFIVGLAVAIIICAIAWPC